LQECQQLKYVPIAILNIIGSAPPTIPKNFKELVNAIQTSGVLHKIFYYYNGQSFQTSIYGPIWLKTALEVFVQTKGFADLSLKEYLEKLNGS
jgi:hypothetical protein